MIRGKMILLSLVAGGVGGIMLGAAISGEIFGVASVLLGIFGAIAGFLIVYYYYRTFS